jgi:hypothetical protein
MAWKSTAALLALSLGILGAIAAPAVAFTLQCVPRGAIFESLKTADGQVPAHVGVTSAGALFEVLLGPNGTWTAFFTFPDGLTCPVAAGEGWRDAPAVGNADPAA